MIIGTGIDIIEISRFNDINQSFLNRIYTPAEQRLFHRNNYQTLAGNFAAKEAVAKAFGTGFNGISPNEIEILRKNDGSPYVVLNGRARDLFNQKGGSKIHISISHSKDNAAAVAIFEREG